MQKSKETVKVPNAILNFNDIPVINLPSQHILLSRDLPLLYLLLL